MYIVEQITDSQSMGKDSAESFWDPNIIRGDSCSLYKHELGDTKYKMMDNKKVINKERSAIKHNFFILTQRNLKYLMTSFSQVIVFLSMIQYSTSEEIGKAADYSQYH